MLYQLLTPFSDLFQLFNLLNYLTVRAGGALITAFLIGALAGPELIKFLREVQTGQQTIRDMLPHQHKVGTPTMGGLLILGSTVLAALFWTDLANPYVWLLIATLLSFGTIGLVDDYLAVKKLWRRGLPGWLRLVLQGGLAAIILLLYTQINQQFDVTTLYLPFIKEAAVEIGIIGLVLFGMLVMVGSANAVNLTDGLDGLASMPAVIVAVTFAILAYVIGRVDFTGYLNISYLPGAGEIAVFCAALAGGILAFLWYNAPPARIFMGDTGSLAIGGTLGAVAVMIKQEFALAIIGGLFVIETLSVILQVASYKLTGKRIFKMAPLHHHFEKLGWPESTIVVRFWIVAILLALIGLATLKLR